jgi:hypothetical protein
MGAHSRAKGNRGSHPAPGRLPVAWSMCVLRGHGTGEHRQGPDGRWHCLTCASIGFDWEAPSGFINWGAPERR